MRISSIQIPCSAINHLATDPKLVIDEHGLVIDEGGRHPALLARFLPPTLARFVIFL